MGVAKTLSPKGNDEVRGFPPEVVCLIGQGVKRIRCQRSDFRYRTSEFVAQASGVVPVCRRKLEVQFVVL